MKKCPVCGVMMGDNVARCFMCKYDFQKASREGEDVARKEAEENVKKNEMEVSGRVSEKKAEEERLIAQIKEKSRAEIETVQHQLEEEKLRLEQEYVEARKRSLEERTRLDKDLNIVRAEIEKEKKALADTATMREIAERAAIKESEGAAKKYIEMAKMEAEQLLKAANAETEALAIQVQKEYNDAMDKRQEVLDEASRLRDEVKAAQKKINDLKAEHENNLLIVSDAKAQAEIQSKDILDKARKEAAALLEDARKESETKLSEVESAHQRLTREAEQLRNEIDTTRASAQEELNGYLEQAKLAIAELEQAQKTRATIDSEIDSIRNQATAVRVEAEAMKKEAEETKQKAQEELAHAKDELEAVRQQTEDAKKKAENDVTVILDEVTRTREQAEKEVQAILSDRDMIRGQVEEEANTLRAEIEQAREDIKNSESERKAAAAEAAEVRNLANAEATEIRRQAAEEAQNLVLVAEKKSITIKESAVSESERGRLMKEYDDKTGSLQSLIDELQENLKARESDLANKGEEVNKIMDELEKLKEQQQHVGMTPRSVPMEYEIEVIPHKLSGEVDSDAISAVLLKRGPKGWKLHSLINDEGGKLQSTLGASEKMSLSSPVSVKEDRVIMIFERVIPANND